jgi:hypothetical protein
MNAGIAYPMAHLGIIGTGLLTIPVLAGSTAYAIGEGRKWPVGLSRKPKRARRSWRQPAFHGISRYCSAGAPPEEPQTGALVERALPLGDDERRNPVADQVRRREPRQANRSARSAIRPQPATFAGRWKRLRQRMASPSNSSLA